MHTTKLDDIHGVPRRARRTLPLNVAGPERVLSVALAAGLVGLGARKKGALGFLSFALGGLLVARAVSGHCPAYAAFGVSTRRTPGFPRGRLALPEALAAHLSRVERSITVARSPAEVYRFLRDSTHIPLFSPHVSRVEDLGNSSFRIGLHAASDVTWEAHLDFDEAARAIVLHHPGEPEEKLSILFAEAPGRRGTEIRVILDLGRERSVLRRALAAFAGEDPDVLLRRDLRRLKMLLETGEIVSSEGQPTGAMFPERPAQPIQTRAA